MNDVARLLWVWRCFQEKFRLKCIRGIEDSFSPVCMDRQITYRVPRIHGNMWLFERLRGLCSKSELKQATSRDEN
jgi:hypothetical protein